MSQLLASGGQSMGASASASVLPMNIQDWFPLGLTGWLSLQSKDSQESSPTLQFKSNNSSALSLFYGPTPIPIHDWTHTPNHTGKTIVLTIQIFVSKVMSLLFNMLSRFVIAFLRRSKHLLIWLQWPSAMILEPKKRSVTVFIVSAMKLWDWMPWS